MADRRDLIYLILFSTLVSTLQAFRFIVGGRDGWVPNPSENYNHWAERMRFQVNDTLLFRYKEGSDSVMVVNKHDYEMCNTRNPVLKLEDGYSMFRFDKSGALFFISGTKSNCQNGQKLIIVVLAVRNVPRRSLPPPPLTAEAPVEDTSPPAAAPSPPAADGDTQPLVDTTSAHRSFATAASISSLILVSTTISLAYICNF